MAIANREFDPIRQRLKAGSISVRLLAVKIIARAHFRGITAACVWITGEIIVAHRRVVRVRKRCPAGMTRRVFDGELEFVT
jgi:hypothetical protein